MIKLVIFGGRLCSATGGVCFPFSIFSYLLNPNANSISSDNINVFLKNIVRFVFDCREVLGIHGQRLLSRNERAWSVSG